VEGAKKTLVRNHSSFAYIKGPGFDQFDCGF
jgi:hypothetical protein